MNTQSRVGLNCVPSLWAVMLDAIDSKKVAIPSGTLSFLFLGGEQLNRQLVDRTFAALPDISRFGISTARLKRQLTRVLEAWRMTAFSR